VPLEQVDRGRRLRCEAAERRRPAEPARGRDAQRALDQDIRNHRIDRVETGRVRSAQELVRQRAKGDDLETEYGGSSVD